MSLLVEKRPEYYRYLNLDNEKLKTRKMSVLYYTHELKRIYKDAKDINRDLDKMRSDFMVLKTKRERLLKQNFSSAPHLQKTHVRYWNTMISIQKRIRQKEKDKQKLYMEFNDVKNFLERSSTRGFV